MIELPGSSRPVSSTTVHEQDGAYVLEVPPDEIEHESITPGGTYRVAIPDAAAATEASTPPPSEPTRASTNGAGRRSRRLRRGWIPEVTIETVHDQGDGTAEVDRGHVVTAPRPGPVNSRRSGSTTSDRTSRSRVWSTPIGEHADPARPDEFGVPLAGDHRRRPGVGPADVPGPVDTGRHDARRPTSIVDTGLTGASRRVGVPLAGSHRRTKFGGEPRRVHDGPTGAVGRSSP
jgi:hypothetical protein